jgi:hypothetical protein
MAFPHEPLRRALERLFKAWKSSSGSAINSSVLPFQPQRLHLMQPINRSPQCSISMSGRWQRWQFSPTATKADDGFFFAAREAAQARFTRLALFLPTRTPGRERGGSSRDFCLKRDGFAGSPNAFDEGRTR